MKRKVLLISLVLVMVLGLSGVSALNFEELGQTSVSSSVSCSKAANLSNSGSGDSNAIIKENGNVDFRGSNYYSSNGPYDGGYLDDYSGGDAEKVAISSQHSCILKENGDVKCQGRNDSGQAVGYGSGDAKDIAVGDHVDGNANTGYSCVLKDNGNVECWGSNPNSVAKNHNTQDIMDIAAGDEATCVVKEDSNPSNGGNVDCYGDSFGQNNAYSYGGGDVTRISVSGHGYVCMLKSNGNVECNKGVQDYTNGDAKGMDSSGGGSSSGVRVCVLKDDTNGNEGNVECYGNTISSGSANDYYNGGDAIGISTTGGHYCVLKQYGSIECFGSGIQGSASDYSCNYPPQYSGFSLTSLGESNGQLQIETSINWSDPENNFKTSYLEHNFSGSPQNETSSQMSHTYSQNLGTGNYYVKFYGEDGAGKINITGKKEFEITLTQDSSFHWEDSSGEISSVGIKDQGKNVDMVANYNGSLKDNTNEITLDIHQSGGGTIPIKSFYNVPVQNPQSNAPSAKQSFEINQSFMNQLSGSSPYQVYFEASYTYPTSYLFGNPIGYDTVSNKSQTLTITNESSGPNKQDCEVSGYSCVSDSSACTNQGGNVLSSNDYVCSSSGQVCCNISESKDKCEVESYTSCEEYDTQSACESNSCNLGPTNSEGCTGSNCGCFWDSPSTGIFGSSQGKCVSYKNTSDDPNTEDGVCYYNETSAGSCSQDSSLEHSWDVRWENSTGTYADSATLPSTCQPGSETVACPSTAELPGENAFTIPLTIVALVGIYAVFYSRRRPDE